MLKNTGKLAGRTIYISGASRGIGREIALKLAKDKANIVIAAKTAEPNPKLAGTIYTVAKEIEDVGGKALPCIVDIRDEKQVVDSVEKAVSTFGGIDVLINNASAISLTKTEATEMKRYDLMHNINGRGTFLVSKVCAPYLKKGTNPHILNISPPLSLNPKWFANHVAYTIAKYNMSLFALGMAEEFRGQIAVNCLWPRTAILTAAMEMLGGGSDIKESCRRPEIMADAAYAVLSRDHTKHSGYFYIDDDILKGEGVTDFSPYLYNKDKQPMLDFFVESNQKSIHSRQYTITDLTSGPPDSTFPPFATTNPSVSTTKEGPSATTSGGEVSKIFEKLKNVITEEIVKKTNAVFQFNIKGANDNVELYYLDLKNAAGAVGTGESKSKSDVTLIMNEPDFIRVFSGQMSPTSAYMTGKLKMKGDITKAMLLDKLLGKMKGKL